MGEHKRHANMIIYHIQTKMGVQISPELAHDIHTNVYKAVQETVAREGQYRKRYNELLEKRFPLKWNELRIRLARTDVKGSDEVLEFMHMLDDGVSIR